jgi:hypothetical protein
MGLQVKALQLESDVRVPALYFTLLARLHWSSIFIYIDIPLVSRFASPLLLISFHHPSLLPKVFSPSYSVVLVLPTSLLLVIQALQANPFFFLSLLTSRTVICHILELVPPIEKRSYTWLPASLSGPRSLTLSQRIRNPRSVIAGMVLSSF